MLAIIAIGVGIVLIGFLIDNGVEKTIENHSDSEKQARDRKATYNVVGKIVARGIVNRYFRK